MDSKKKAVHCFICKEFKNGFLLLFFPPNAHEKSSGQVFPPLSVYWKYSYSLHL
jgi:hypothetical protein